MSLCADDARHPEHGRKSQDPLPPIPTKGWASVSPRRLPPTSPTAYARSFRPSYDRMGRHRCLGLAAEGPASNTLSRPIPGGARPKCLPAIHRSNQATCRLSASAMVRSPSTPTSGPTSDVPVASHAPPDGVAPFGTPPARLSQARGRPAFRPLDPHHDDRSPWWIYPNLTDPSTSCHEPVSPCARKTTPCNGPAVWASLPNGSARCASLALGAPSRAATHAPSRKKSTGSRTRGAFHQAASPFGEWRLGPLLRRGAKPRRLFYRLTRRP